MKNFLQKLFAAIFNSQYIVRNPYINFVAFNEYRRTTIFKKLISLGTGSVLYPEAIVYNNSNDPSKIIVGTETHIQGELNVFGYGGKITIGNNTYIGKDSRIWSGDSVTIGNDVLISHFCNIIDTNSHEINPFERAERSKEIFISGHWKTKGSVQTSPIVIDDYAWISFNVAILRGVTIGKGSIIGAGSVVVSDIPEWCFAAGNPAKVIRHLNEEERMKNQIQK